MMFLRTVEEVRDAVRSGRACAGDEVYLPSALWATMTPSQTAELEAWLRAHGVALVAHKSLGPRIVIDAPDRLADCPPSPSDEAAA